MAEVERAACANADSIRPQRRRCIAAITHVQGTRREGGRACVGVDTLHHPLASTRFGEAAGTRVVGQHGGHGVVVSIGACQGQQTTSGTAVGQRARVAEHQSTRARSFDRRAVVTQGEQAVGAGGGARVLERGVVDDQVRHRVGGLTNVAGHTAVGQTGHRRCAAIQLGHAGVGVGCRQGEGVGSVFHQVARAADGLGKCGVCCLVKTKASVVHHIGHHRTCRAEFQITCADSGEAAVSVDTSQIHITCALLQQVSRCASDDARQNAVAAGVIHSQGAAIGQVDAKRAVDVCAAQQDVTVGGIACSNGAVQGDVTAVNAEGTSNVQWCSHCHRCRVACAA